MATLPNEADLYAPQMKKYFNFILINLENDPLLILKSLSLLEG